MSDYEPPMPIMKAVASSISQNTEQNVRTQSLQIAEIVERITDLSLVNCYPEFGEVQDWMIEAEARGAEEQRRKDGEDGRRWRALSALPSEDIVDLVRSFEWFNNPEEALAKILKEKEK